MAQKQVRNLYADTLYEIEQFEPVEGLVMHCGENGKTYVAAKYSEDGSPYDGKMVWYQETDGILVPSIPAIPPPIFVGNLLVGDPSNGPQTTLGYSGVYGDLTPDTYEDPYYMTTATIYKWYSSTGQFDIQLDGPYFAGAEMISVKIGTLDPFNVPWDRATYFVKTGDLSAVHAYLLSELGNTIEVSFQAITTP